MINLSDTNYTKPKRLNFTNDEKHLPWLKTLLNAYFIIDKGINSAINREMNHGRKLACAKGCSSCCTTHQDIPVYPLELMGMSWYVIEKLQSPLREQLKKQLENANNLLSCPFLLDGTCSIHPMRPAACRQFNVLDTPCTNGEDAFYSRKQDVMIPIQHYIDNAFDIMLPFYGIKKKAERRKAIKQGTLHSVAKSMKACNWQTLPKKMNNFDSNK